MTRTYAARRLLEHGPLSMAQFKEITGWPEKQAHRVMQDLLKQGLARRLKPASHRKTRLYGLPSQDIAGGFGSGTKQKPIGFSNDAGRTCHG